MLLQRLGIDNDRVTINIRQSNNSDRDYYRVNARDGVLYIEANCVVAATNGLYNYFKSSCGTDWSWCGNSEFIAPKIVNTDGELAQIIEQKYRTYYNYCTFGYSSSLWNWERWEKEIDYMALNGINMPLFMVGFEKIWCDTLIEFGFTISEALQFVSGPCHYAWQAMTNIEGVCHAPSVEYIEDRYRLGKRIYDRQVELGMSPIMMGFSGFVPRLFEEKFPNAKILLKKDWCAFRGTAELDPLDPLFKKFGSRLLANQKKLFGDSHLYASDPFHESTPPKSGKKYLVAVSNAINGLYKEHDPDYKWIMQTWSVRKNIVKASEKERLILLDLNGEKYKKKKYYWGYSFIEGNLQNFGGRINLHGDIHDISKNKYIKANEKGNVVGTGLFMEGICHDPIYYLLALDMLTRSDVENLDNFAKKTAFNRYGISDVLMIRAVRKVIDEIYKKGSNGVERSSIICARPALEVKCSGPNHGFRTHYKNSVLRDIIAVYLSFANAESKDGLYFDLYDFTRQYASNYLQVVQKNITKCYEERDRLGFDKWKTDFLHILYQIDDLLCTRPEYNLHHELGMIDKLTDDKQLASYYEHSYRTLLSYWGKDIRDPDIFDYAWREWGGLIDEYYLPRWRIWLDYLSENFDCDKRLRYSIAKERKLSKNHGRESFRACDVFDRIADFELAFVSEKRKKVDVAYTHGDTIRLVKQILSYIPQK